MVLTRSKFISVNFMVLDFFLNYVRLVVVNVCPFLIGNCSTNCYLYGEKVKSQSMEKESRSKFRRKAVEKPKIINVWPGISQREYFLGIPTLKFLGIIVILIQRNRY